MAVPMQLTAFPLPIQLSLQGLSIFPPDVLNEPKLPTLSAIIASHYINIYWLRPVPSRH